MTLHIPTKVELILLVNTEFSVFIIIMLHKNQAYNFYLRKLVANKSKSRWWFPVFDLHIKLYMWFILKIILRYVVSRYTSLLLFQVFAIFKVSFLPYPIQI